MLNPLKGKMHKEESSNKGFYHHHYHNLCEQHMGKNVAIELDDGNVYHGQLHSYDNENMYLIMEGESRIFFIAPFPFIPGFGIFGFPFYRIRRFRPYWW